VLKRTYFMTVIDGEFCLQRMSAVVYSKDVWQTRATFQSSCLMTHWPVSGACFWSQTPSRLVPETGQSVILFWCQKPTPDRTCSISGRKPAGKMDCDWSVWADYNTARLFVNKNGAAFSLRCFFECFQQPEC